MGRIYLVAEADAGDRASWPGPDRFRPITRDGWKQARELAATLRGRQVSWIVASPWLRCRQTLVPLAEELGLDVDEHRSLAESMPVERILNLLAELPDTTVVCTHADVVRNLVALYGTPAADTPIGPWELEVAAALPGTA
ncbi:MAG TPA: phosphoglycerate mutase family protein [Candidatus Dormibacteraeota bacterium]